MLAYCALAWWHDDLYLHRGSGSREDNALDHRSLAESALSKAARVRPDAGELHLAKAVHALKINHDAEQADRELQLAHPSLPNNALLEAVTGRIARRQDRWDVALRCLERAAALEPRDWELHDLLPETYRFLRRYDDFDRTITGLITLTPAEQKHASLITRGRPVGPVGRLAAVSRARDRTDKRSPHRRRDRRQILPRMVVEEKLDFFEMPRRRRLRNRQAAPSFCSQTG